MSHENVFLLSCSLVMKTQIAFQIVSALVRCWRLQNDAVPTLAYIESLLARFGMLSELAITADEDVMCIQDSH